MSTLVGIEQAVGQLTTAERQQLSFSLARALRHEQALPPPRTFSLDDMAAWMDEDEAAFKALKEKPLSFFSTAAFNSLPVADQLGPRVTFFPPQPKKIGFCKRVNTLSAKSS